MSDLSTKLRNGDLYAVLTLATQRELAPLVQIITHRWFNTLKSQQLYRLHKPDHTKYNWLIGDEIRLYGGNSGMNLLRNKQGPAYSEIVEDVCTKLGISIPDASTIDSELAVLELVAPSGSEIRRKLECFDLGEDAWKVIKSSVSEQWWVAKMGVSAVTTAFFPPLGLPMLAKTVVDPTYQVTVPCVLHVAFLRQRFIGENRGS